VSKQQKLANIEDFLTVDELHAASLHLTAIDKLDERVVAVVHRALNAATAHRMESRRFWYG
jgi:hypothetical protein